MYNGQEVTIDNSNIKLYTEKLLSASYQIVSTLASW